MAEHLTVDQGVVGSTPISHPENRLKRGDFCLTTSLLIIAMEEYAIIKLFLEKIAKP